jgi:hypothetical protein
MLLGRFSDLVFRKRGAIKGRGILRAGRGLKRACGYKCLDNRCLGLFWMAGLLSA